jgi:hypothetical protein
MLAHPAVRALVPALLVSATAASANLHIAFGTLANGGTHALAILAAHTPNNLVSTVLHSVS